MSKGVTRSAEGCLLARLRWAALLCFSAVVVSGCGELVPTRPVGVSVEVVLAGEGIGRVTSTPEGIATAANRFTATFENGTAVTLTAEAADGSVFTGWSDPGCRSNGPCTIALDENATVIASFDLVPSDEASLTIALDGDGEGSVASDPEGIATGDGAFIATFVIGTVVTLRAEPAEGNVLAGFDGVECDEGSADDTCTFTFDGVTSVTVRFERVLDPIELVYVASLVAVAGAQLTLVVPPEVEAVEVESLRSQTTVRSGFDGTSLRLAWVGDAAEAGAQVRVRFVPPLMSIPEMEEAIAFEAAGSADLGAEALQLSVDQLGLVERSPLVVDPVAVGSLPLDPSWAERPLGDIDGNGVLDVGDVLLLLELTRSGDFSDDQLYHADLTLSDSVDVADLELALERLVDPTMPARLHVRPSAIPFVALDGADETGAWVLVGNAGRAPFGAVAVEAPPGVAVTRDEIAGQSLALGLDLPVSARRGWRPGWLRITAGSESESVRVGHLVVVVAGQSNATGLGSPLTGWPEVPSPTVRVLGNDYRWRNLVEPMDDTTGQLDVVSRDDNVLYSMGTRLGFSLWDATGFESYLVPSTRNGSELALWLPRPDRLDRGTLFGSTNFRAQVSAGLQPNPASDQPFGSEGGPVTALVWYQGESDANSGARRSAFQGATNTVMDAFVEALGVPVIYVQLASDWREQVNVEQHAVAELQRQMESTWGVLGQRRQNYHMVVAFDLPRSDRIHLSAYGQRVLAERVSLAIRQHVLGEDVDGTGPRLNRDRVAWSGTTVWVQTTHVLAATPINEAYFTVYDGPPSGSLDDVANYGENAIPIVAAERDPGDPSVVRLTLDREPVLTPRVRYMALPSVGPSTSGPSAPGAWEIMAPGVVVAAEGGLPLPVFGPLAAVARP